MEIRRLLRHLWLDTDDARHALGNDGLARIESCIRTSESTHLGEICVCVEAALPRHQLWRHLRHRVPFEHLMRERAIELFGAQRVWDTEANNGVLIYLLLAEHHVEILADRGVSRHVPETYWNALLGEISLPLRERRLTDGILRAIAGVGTVLQQHFPCSGAMDRSSNVDELPDKPSIL